MRTYAPMAKTSDGNTLFVTNNCASMEEAVYAFSVWEDHYHYAITDAWIDVFDDNEKVQTIPVRRVWQPIVE